MSMPECRIIDPNERGSGSYSSAIKGKAEELLPEFF